MKYRKLRLLFCAAIGIVLSFGLIYCIRRLSEGNNNNISFLREEKIEGSLFILPLSLPTMFVLWLFRTHDVKSAYDLSNIQKITDLCVSDSLRARSVELGTNC